MAKRDYYDILGITKGASADEIKKAYRKQAIKFHPDKNPGDKEAEEMFKEAAEAYEILSNPEKKQRYDQFGHAGTQGGGGYGGGDRGYGGGGDRGYGGPRGGGYGGGRDGSYFALLYVAVMITDAVLCLGGGDRDRYAGGRND